VPIVRIDIQAGKSTMYKRDILHGVRSAITVALGVEDDRVMQRLIETPVENIDITEGRTDRLTIIEVSMLPGRGADLKSALYSAIVANLGEKPGIHQRDIMVIVNDPSAECFAIGGVMQCTLATSSAEAPFDEPRDEPRDEDDSLVEDAVGSDDAGAEHKAPAVEGADAQDEAPAAVEDAPIAAGEESHKGNTKGKK
jgi:phenylpyruvate tautomerase PptA (4-oxalocrotonate tautomerase family)